MNLFGMTEEEKRNFKPNASLRPDNAQMNNPSLVNIQSATGKRDLLSEVDDKFLGVGNALRAGASGQQTPYVSQPAQATSMDYPKGRATAFTPKSVVSNPTALPQSSKGLLKDTALTNKLTLPEPATEARKLTNRNLLDTGAKVEGASELASLPFGGNTQQGIKNAVDETLPPPEVIQKEVVETEDEIKQAAEDPSMWKQFTDKLGVAGDAAWEEAKDAAGRVDWLTMAIVAAASASTGSSATKAIANGLLRGIEARTNQNQQAAANKAATDKNTLLAEQQAIENTQADYRNKTGRMNAEAYATKAEEDGEAGVPDLSANERAVVGAMPDDFTPAVWNQAAMELKKRGKAIDPVSMKRVATLLQEKGIVSDDWFGTDSLV